jgi:anti-sigma factor ChrR (cupin superfamily)
MTGPSDKSAGKDSADAALRFLGLDDPGNVEGVETEAEILAWADRLLPLDGADAPPPPAHLWQKIEGQIGVAPGILTVQRDEGIWETLGSGLRRKIVHVDAATGRASYFLELAKGARLPEHEHPADEHCVVLEGTLRIGARTFGAGAYQLARSGFPHPPVVAETAAMVFIHGPV